MKQFAVTSLLILSVTKYVVPMFREITLSSKNQERKVFWTLENEKKSIHVPAKVPGGVYSDLQNAGKIEDILKGYNDLGTRWVANATWIYRVTFLVEEEDLQANVVQLVLHGIDTLSFIELNGALIDSTSNMFVRYVFDIKQHLRSGDNELKISFVPPIEAANARLSTSSAEPYCVPAMYHGECHVNQLRKMQASFAWDFAPAFPSVGLWKPIALELYDGAMIRSVTVHTKKGNTHWKLIIVIYLETPKIYGEIKGVLSAVLTVNNNRTIKEGRDFAVVTNEEGTLVKRLNLKIPAQDVDLWWPNGYGNQALYELSVFVFTAGNLGENYQKTIKIGFRTIELVEERTGVNGGNGTAGKGRTFFFKVNGYPLFMKGANWVPAHILPEHSGDERVVDHLLQSARDAHMTMLRVWGGGLYESDFFYQRCDELGLLVWQDFLFSCSMYPTDPEFLESVSLEVQQNVIRLQHHPSLAIWAGNNEIELALRGNWFPSTRDFDTNLREYVKLFIDTIKPIVKELDPGRRYLISSPSNGLESETKREFVSENPGDSHFGDSHHYVHYMADNWDASSYFYTRFASEYGFQSLPSIETMSKAIDDEEELNIYSEYSQHRQHSPNRYSFIERQIDLHLGEYDKTFHSNDYEKYIFFSQIVQAMSLKTASEFYRQSRAYWQTMGALYWQLNDVWQAPSASSIEYGGKWKMVHYFAKRFFAPILLSTRLLHDGDIDIYVINDRLSPIVDAEIIVDVFNWTSLVPLSSNVYKTTDIEPLSSTKQDIKIVLWDKQRNSEIFIRFSFRKKGVALSPFNFVFPASLKSIHLLRNANIKVTVQPRLRQLKNRFYYKVFIEVDAVVLFLWLEAENLDGRFQDNGLIITEQFTYVNFISNKILKPAQLQKSIKWRYYHNQK